MATVRELVTKWGFEINDKPLKDMNAAIKDATIAVAAVGGAMVAAAGTIFGFAKFTANAGEEALKMSQKLGISTVEFGRLSHAAHMADIDSSSFGTAMRFLSKNLVSASEGSKQTAKSFSELGIPLRNNDGKLKSSNQLLLEVADRFKKLEPGPKKTAMAMELFGRAGADMIPLLNKGSEAIKGMGDEAEALGLTFTETEAKLSDDFNDSLKETQAIFTGIRNTIGKQLIPVVMELVKEFNEFLKENRVAILENISFIIEGLGGFVKKLWGFFKALVTSAKGFIQLFGGFKKVFSIVSAIAAVIGGGILLHAIGALTTAVIGLVGWFTAANIAALAIPIAIGAAVALIGLIIEDIVTFFQGGDSFFGDIVNYLKTEFPNAFKLIKGYIDIWIFQFQFLWSIIQRVASSLIQAFTLVGQVLNSIFAPIFEKIGSIIGLAARFAGPLLGKLGETMSAGASVAAKALPSISNVSSMNVNAPINVNAGGLPAGQAVSAIENGLGNGIGQLRAADAANKGGAVY